MDAVAMHISNGIINGQVSAAFALVAAFGVAICVLRGRGDLDDRLAPMAGLVAAFIFAVQMLNYPIFTAGVSGHLLGGALAAILVGPWVGALCLSVVLIVQALVIADGGVTAIGLNITNMALVGTVVGYGLAAALLRVLPRTTVGLGIASFVSALVSVVVAAMGFVVQFALGGAIDLGSSISVLAGTMLTTHVLIGLGEGAITAATVIAVARVRPDLVYAMRKLRTPAAPAAVPVRGGVA